jgi:hypothetical protein
MRNYLSSFLFLKVLEIQRSLVEDSAELGRLEGKIDTYLVSK